MIVSTISVNVLTGEWLQWVDLLLSTNCLREFLMLAGLNVLSDDSLSWSDCLWCESAVPVFRWLHWTQQPGSRAASWSHVRCCCLVLLWPNLAGLSGSAERTSVRLDAQQLRHYASCRCFPDVRLSHRDDDGDDEDEDGDDVSFVWHQQGSWRAAGVKLPSGCLKISCSLHNCGFRLNEQIAAFLHGLDSECALCVCVCVLVRGLMSGSLSCSHRHSSDNLSDASHIQN